MTRGPSKHDRPDVIRKILAPLNLHYVQRQGRGRPRNESSYHEMAFMYLQYQLCVASGDKGMNMPELAAWFRCTTANIFNRHDDFCIAYPADCNRIDAYIRRIVQGKVALAA